MIASIKREMQEPRLAGSVRDDQFNRASPNPAEHQRCSSLAPRSEVSMDLFVTCARSGQLCCEHRRSR
jgi:hypothetical protein